VNRRRGAITAVLALSALASGCNYFRAAQPEAPHEIPFVASYDLPEATLQTIVDAIQDKARTIGLTAYAGAFAESTVATTPGFHQRFSPEDEAVWQASGHTVPPDWNFSRERNFYIRLATFRPDPYELEWTKDLDNDDTSPSADVMILHRHYVLHTLAQDGSVSGTVAIGFADLTLVRFTNGDWRIALWEDRIDPGFDRNDPEQLTLGRRRLNTTQ